MDISNNIAVSCAQLFLPLADSTQINIDLVRYQNHSATIFFERRCLILHYY